MRVEQYAYCVNELCQSVGLETSIWRQIATSQTAQTKYKLPPYATEWNPPHEILPRTPLQRGLLSYVSLSYLRRSDNSETSYFIFGCNKEFSALGWIKRAIVLLPNKNKHNTAARFRIYYCLTQHTTVITLWHNSYCSMTQQSLVWRNSTWMSPVMSD